MDTFNLHPNTQLQLFHPKHAPSLDPDTIYTVNQKHTDQCVLLSNTSKAPKTSVKAYVADALATNCTNTPLGIQTADCLSLVLSFGNKTKAHSLVNLHAGWRGLLGGIIESTIKTYLEKMKQDSDSFVKIFIGPSIRKCCFIVKKDVIPNFDQWAKHKTRFDASAYRNALPWTSNSVLPEEAYIDLIGLAKFILEDTLPKSLEINFDIHPDCTVCSKNHWGSFRRNKSYIEKNWLVATLTP